MKKQEEKDIELRCEEVQEILTRPPHALIRWGITVFFGVLALLFIGGSFFKYPDIVSAGITITTEHPPVWIVARGSGKIQEVYCKDRENVRVGDIIAVLENPAITAHVLELKERITSFILTDSCICQTVFPEKPELGNIQNAYASFIKCLTDYRNFLSIDLYAQKEQAACKELQEYQKYIRHLNKQAELDEEQVQIASATHSREKKLFDKGLISKADYEEAQQTYLNRRQGREQLMTSLSSARIQEAQLQQNIVEIRMERNREANTISTSLKSALNDLQVSISDWELGYLFTSPASGILSYNNIWQKNQNVNAGDKVFSIVASTPGDIIGKIKLPVSGSGKVCPGQRVNISVTGYPYMEFGFLTGEVLSVSLLASEDNMYTVTVGLPQNLCTSYGKQLDFKGELSGTAEVMTDERSVTARLLSPLRYLWEKYL
nr:HlyD family efflux transporter periplasmic adaptor subunit [Bacteroides intestinalis]